MIGATENDRHILERKVNLLTNCTVKRSGEKKVRVCARGDQQPSSSYDDTYSPTLRTELLKLILANAVRKQHHIEFLDITAAYLNADLPSDTELYIPPLPMKIIKTKLIKEWSIDSRRHCSVCGVVAYYGSSY
ncbi:unnamed protein product [Ambrosiozyma monospora]|uniref:Unnamed protein product n=1 Tax=Ambrosiozyma monospora TaxID=43982 RepID=A0A9W7DG34_AMBMO|nr:unnamed protein product [Ambrosiozyma monospora]